MAESTTDYSKFHILLGNRRVNKAHVGNLAKSMALYPDLFAIRPILVNKQFEVIDGQHRLQAAKNLGVPVWYEVGGDIKTEDAVILNEHQRNWTALDYARSYAARGSEDYKEFLRAHEAHPLVPLHVIMRYLGGPSKDQMSNFRRGDFKSITADIGEVYLEMLEELIELYPRFGMNAPASAMFRVFQVEGYDHDRMISKVRSVPEDTINLYGRIEPILRNLEDVYNYKQRTDKKRFY